MMDWFTFNPLYAWGGLATVGIAACAAVAYFFPPFRKHAVAVGLGIIGIMTLYRKGVKDGQKNVQTKWDKAEKKSVERGKQAHDTAKRDVAAGVRDKFDRDDL